MDGLLETLFSALAAIRERLLQDSLTQGMRALQVGYDLGLDPPDD